MGESTSLYGNRILDGLCKEDLSLLRPSICVTNLPVHMQLEQRGRLIEYVYFPDSGIASVLGGSGRKALELGIIGKEGMTGIGIILGAKFSPHETFVQCEGRAWRICAVELQLAMDQSPALHRHLLRYALVFFHQVSSTTVANGIYKVEERLARWLLMATDRLESDRVPLTHEMLALMLGTRRAGVTTALQSFAKQGILRTERGSVTVIDRRALEAAAHGCYDEHDTQYRRLFGDGTNTGLGSASSQGNVLSSQHPPTLAAPANYP